MAHFYGTLRGSRGGATRGGTKQSGLTTSTASWEGAVQVQAYEKNGVDYVMVSLTPWRGAGVNRVLYDGPISGEESHAACRCDTNRYCDVHPDRGLNPAW